MFCIEEVIQDGVVVALLAHFTNTFDAFYLLGRVFWHGCEFIAFTTHNMFTEYTNIFPTASRMHTLPHPSTMPQRSSEGRSEEEQGGEGGG
ncbi:Auxin-induced protein 5NG4 [Hordeum vulgare]|nr:Auxin-induced protein 5NG4 [Hordeum vulgare]